MASTLHAVLPDIFQLIFYPPLQPFVSDFSSIPSCHPSPITLDIIAARMPTARGYMTIYFVIFTNLMDIYPCVQVEITISLC